MGWVAIGAIPLIGDDDAIQFWSVDEEACVIDVADLDNWSSFHVKMKVKFLGEILSSFFNSIGFYQL